VKRHVATTCLFLGLLAGLAAGQAAQVTTITGESFTGRLIRIADAAAEFVTVSGTRKLPARDLWQIRLTDSADPMEVPGQKVVVLTGPAAGVLAAQELSLQADKLSVESKLLGAVTIDVTAVAAIYLPRQDQKPRACQKTMQDMELPNVKKDYLLARNPKGNWVPVPGVLKGIASGKVTFEFSGEDRTVDLSSVQAIRLAAVPTAGPAPAGQLVGKDGSTVPFGSISLAGARVSIAAAGLKAQPADLAAVADIRFRSERCVYLSELAPAKVTQVGLFDVAFAFRRDRSSAGTPIQLDGRTYTRGIGLHSRCELSYDLGGKFLSFAALAGIDAAGGSRGNATLSLLGDGKPLIQPVKLTGSGKPVSLRCSLAGLKEFTLLVDFGDDGIDVGDHVSLADARLVKP